MPANAIVINNPYEGNKKLYEILLESKKNTVKNILIMGSISNFEFNNYFKNAHIDYVNILNRVPVHFMNDKTKIYDINGKQNIDILINDIFDKNIKYDIIIDDGIHTEKTVKFYMSHYTEWITEDGIIIIEDVADWVDILTNDVPDELTNNIEIYNMVNNNDKIDNVVFVIDKSFKR